MHNFVATSKYKRVRPLLLAVVLGLLAGAGCLKRSPPPGVSPAWIDTPPRNHYVGSAYYGVETEDGARRNAVADAISSLLVLKAGVATVSSEVRQAVESRVRDSSEKVSATATISTNSCASALPKPGPNGAPAASPRWNSVRMAGSI